MKIEPIIEPVINKKIFRSGAKDKSFAEWNAPLEKNDQEATMEIKHIGANVNRLIKIIQAIGFDSEPGESNAITENNNGTHEASPAKPKITVQILKSNFALFRS